MSSIDEQMSDCIDDSQNIDTLIYNESVTTKPGGESDRLCNDVKPSACPQNAASDCQWTTSLSTNGVVSKPQKFIKSRLDGVAIERSNLLSICKLVIKQLIDLSLSRGCMLNGDNEHLLQFLTVMECIFCHGLKSRKGLIRDTERRDCWEIIEQLGASYWPSVISSIRDMSIRTNLGRFRAWLRLSLMQKTLADYFKILVDGNSKLLMDYYIPGSLMLADEAAVVSGLLVGVNIVDCSIALKDDDLDLPVGVVDYSLYLKEILTTVPTHEDSSELVNEIAAIVDQKNYLEEVNKNLTASVAKLGKQLDAMHVANAALREETSNVQSKVVKLQQENALLRCENSALSEGHQRQMQAVQLDIDVERETYRKSRIGLDVLYHETKQQLASEAQRRVEVEKELEIQTGIKQEMELAVRLLEKDIHDKCEVTVAMQKQLDDIKAMYLDVNTRLHNAESSLQHKTDMVTRLEAKTSQMAATIYSIDVERKQILIEKTMAEEAVKRLNQQLTESEKKKSDIEAELRVEREWRGTLQKSLEQEKLLTARQQSELRHMTDLKKDHDLLQLKYQELRSQCNEQENALTELGSHLSLSKLKMEDLKEAQMVMKEAQWAEDKEVTHCRQCCKMFSVSRRKHHCRNCGEIFCNECSTIKMPIPSSAKPVRVCDTCSTALQLRYSTN